MKQVITKITCDGCDRDITNRSTVVLTVGTDSQYFPCGIECGNPETVVSGKPVLHLCTLECAGEALAKMYDKCKEARLKTISSFQGAGPGGGGGGNAGGSGGVM